MRPPSKFYTVQIQFSKPATSTAFLLTIGRWAQPIHLDMYGPYALLVSRQSNSLRADIHFIF